MAAGPPASASNGQAAKEKDGYGKERETSGSRDWRCTTKPGKIYIHIFKWPAGKFELPAVNGKIKKAYLLADHKPLKVTQTDAGVTLNLPSTAPDKIASVVALETE